MKTFRSLFYLFLAANLVLAVFSVAPLLGIQLPWAPTGEADRLIRQLNPEKIRPLPAEQVAPKSVDAPQAPANDTAAVSSTAVCVALRNLTTEANAQLADLAGKQGDGVSLRTSGVVSPSYWVHIPPSGGKDGATKRADVLAKAGVEDYLIVRDAGPTQYAISLGLFRNEDAANRLVEQLRKKKITSARIAVRDNTGNNAKAEVSGRSDLVEPLLKDFIDHHKDVQHAPCTAN